MRSIAEHTNGWTWGLEGTRPMLNQALRRAFWAQTVAGALASEGILRSLYAFSGVSRARPPSDKIQALQLRMRRLADADWANAESGLYPRRSLFPSPLLRRGRAVVQVLYDTPNIARRRRDRDYQDLPPEAKSETYPAYYRRNFHWQSDGWLSERSAGLYDASVELLFGGTANMMRRMTLPPLRQATQSITQPKILDIGCGTGSFLPWVQHVAPKAEITAVDLSPFYLKYAEKSGVPAKLVQANAESLPFDADQFDVVTTTFMLHELPRSARTRVLLEMVRALRPGGTMILCDAGQIADSQDIAFFLESFPETYHEPYFREYLKDTLEPSIESLGIRVVGNEAHGVSKVVWGTKQGHHLGKQSSGSFFST
jgi:ubiquinone/menaquinone biosynthesis C-methylase UbiE